MAYYQVESTGKGFITHEDNELAHVAGFPANVWVTENTAWAIRVGAVEKTKEEAQAIIDAELIGQTYSEEHPQAGEQITLTLP
jgi:hypothetical protein